MANNRICLTCGKAYEYCGSCNDNLRFPVWMNIFDTENCKNIFETVSDYAQKMITKDCANEKLSKCNLSHVDNLKDNIKKLVKEITSTENIVQSVENENEQVIEKPKRYRKKKVTVTE